MKLLMLGENRWFRYSVALTVSIIVLFLVQPFRDRTAVEGSFRDMINHVLTGMGAIVAVIMNIFWCEYLEKVKANESVSPNHSSPEIP